MTTHIKADTWLCSECGQRKEFSRFYYLKFDWKGVEYSWAIICKNCWPQTTLQQRLAIYAESCKEKENSRYWEKVAAAIWAEE